ncbi:MAG: cold-shock protein [Acidimicrobiia bacterium]
MRTPWIVYFADKGWWGALRAGSPEEIEAKHPDLRVVVDLPDWLKEDVHGLKALCDSARDVDDHDDVLLRAIRRERSIWSNPVAGRVKWFNAEKGIGAISCPETAPDDVWVHFSMIEGTGYRALAEGEAVEMEFEPARQDSFNYRALRVRRPPTPG